MKKLVLSVLVTVALTSLAAPMARGRELTFHERVEAQEAIERVYYSHQIGATRSFEEAVPREVLERKVRRYLKQSLALERFWNTAITGEALRLELERMVRGTRMPERLRELYAALDGDPVLIQECLARPALVARLVHGFFAYDEQIHGEARREADELRDALAAGLIDPLAEHRNRRVIDLVRIDADPAAGSRNGSTRLTPVLLHRD